MTIEEINVKISADASSFKSAVASANSALFSLKQNAVEAGNEVTKAFSRLIKTDITANSITPSGKAASAASVLSSGGTQSSAGVIEDLSTSGMRSQRAAGFPTLTKNETVIGSVSDGFVGPAQQINLTSTIELDGDKVGQSVQRYNLRGARITNGSGN